MSAFHSLKHGHFALAAASAAMLASGFALITGAEPGFATRVSAQVGPQLEISLPAPISWGPEVGPVWQTGNAAPGDVIEGSVLLRTVAANPADMYLTLRAEMSSPDANAFAEALVIEEMRLGGLDLLPLWLPQCGGSGGTLTLAEVVSCEGDAELPAPSTAGATFVMSIVFDQAAGNRLQAADTGPVTFFFDLWEEDAPGPGPGGPGEGPIADPSPSPNPSPSPSATPTPNPGDGGEGPDDGPPTVTATPNGGGDGTSVPVVPPDATATPSPPDTGTGVGAATGFGYALIGLGALGVAAWLGLLDAGFRRRRNNRA